MSAPRGFGGRSGGGGGGERDRERGGGGGRARSEMMSRRPRGRNWRGGRPRQHPYDKDEEDLENDNDHQTGDQHPSKPSLSKPQNQDAVTSQGHRHGNRRTPRKNRNERGPKVNTGSRHKTEAPESDGTAEGLKENSYRDPNVRRGEKQEIIGNPKGRRGDGGENGSEPKEQHVSEDQEEGRTRSGAVRSTKSGGRRLDWKDSRRRNISMSGMNRNDQTQINAEEENRGLGDRTGRRSTRRRSYGERDGASERSYSITSQHPESDEDVRDKGRRNAKSLSEMRNTESNMNDVTWKKREIPEGNIRSKMGNNAPIQSKTQSGSALAGKIKGRRMRIKSGQSNEKDISLSSAENVKKWRRLRKKKLRRSFSPATSDSSSGLEELTPSRRRPRSRKVSFEDDASETKRRAELNRKWRQRASESFQGKAKESSYLTKSNISDEMKSATKLDSSLLNGDEVDKHESVAHWVQSQNLEIKKAGKAHHEHDLSLTPSPRPHRRQSSGGSEDRKSEVRPRVSLGSRLFALSIGDVKKKTTPSGACRERTSRGSRSSAGVSSPDTVTQQISNIAISPQQRDRDISGTIDETTEEKMTECSGGKNKNEKEETCKDKNEKKETYLPPLPQENFETFSEQLPLTDVGMESQSWKPPGDGGIILDCKTSKESGYMENSVNPQKDGSCPSRLQATHDLDSEHRRRYQTSFSRSRDVKHSRKEGQQYNAGRNKEENRPHVVDSSALNDENKEPRKQYQHSFPEADCKDKISSVETRKSYDIISQQHSSTLKKDQVRSSGPKKELSRDQANESLKLEDDRNVGRTKASHQASNSKPWAGARSQKQDGREMGKAKEWFASEDWERDTGKRQCQIQSEKQNVTPPKQRQTVTPLKQRQNVTPPKQRQNITPPKQRQNVIPPKQKTMSHSEEKENTHKKKKKSSRRKSKKESKNFERECSPTSLTSEQKTWVNKREDWKLDMSKNGGRRATDVDVDETKHESAPLSSNTSKPDLTVRTDSVNQNESCLTTPLVRRGVLALNPDDLKHCQKYRNITNSNNNSINLPQRSSTNQNVMVKARDVLENRTNQPVSQPNRNPQPTDSKCSETQSLKTQSKPHGDASVWNQNTFGNKNIGPRNETSGSRDRFGVRKTEIKGTLSSSTPSLSGVKKSSSVSRLETASRTPRNAIADKTVNASKTLSSSQVSIPSLMSICTSSWGSSAMSKNDDDSSDKSMTKQTSKSTSFSTGSRPQNSRQDLQVKPNTNPPNLCSGKGKHEGRISPGQLGTAQNENRTKTNRKWDAWGGKQFSWKVEKTQHLKSNDISCSETWNDSPIKTLRPGSTQHSVFGGNLSEKDREKGTASNNGLVSDLGNTAKMSKDEKLNPLTENNTATSNQGEFTDRCSSSHSVVMQTEKKTNQSGEEKGDNLSTKHSGYSMENGQVSGLKSNNIPISEIWIEAPIENCLPPRSTQLSERRRWGKNARLSRGETTPNEPACEEKKKEDIKIESGLNREDSESVRESVLEERGGRSNENGLEVKAESRLSRAHQASRQNVHTSVGISGMRSQHHHNVHGKPPYFSDHPGGCPPRPGWMPWDGGFRGNFRNPSQVQFSPHGPPLRPPGYHIDPSPRMPPRDHRGDYYYGCDYYDLQEDNMQDMPRIEAGNGGCALPGERGQEYTGPPAQFMLPSPPLPPPPPPRNVPLLPSPDGPSHQESFPSPSAQQSFSFSCHLNTSFSPHNHPNPQMNEAPESGRIPPIIPPPGHAHHRSSDYPGPIYTNAPVGTSATSVMMSSHQYGNPDMSSLTNPSLGYHGNSSNSAQPFSEHNTFPPHSSPGEMSGGNLVYLSSDVHHGGMISHVSPPSHVPQAHLDKHPTLSPVMQSVITHAQGTQGPGLSPKLQESRKLYSMREKLSKSKVRTDGCSNNVDTNPYSLSGERFAEPRVPICDQRYVVRDMAQTSDGNQQYLPPPVTKSSEPVSPNNIGLSPTAQTYLPPPVPQVCIEGASPVKKPCYDSENHCNDTHSLLSLKVDTPSFMISKQPIVSPCQKSSALLTKPKQIPTEWIGNEPISEVYQVRQTGETEARESNQKQSLNKSLNETDHTLQPSRDQTRKEANRYVCPGRRKAMAQLLENQCSGFKEGDIITDPEVTTPSIPAVEDWEENESSKPESPDPGLIEIPYKLTPIDLKQNSGSIYEGLNLKGPKEDPRLHLQKIEGTTIMSPKQADSALDLFLEQNEDFFNEDRCAPSSDSNDNSLTEEEDSKEEGKEELDESLDSSSTDSSYSDNSEYAIGEKSPDILVGEGPEVLCLHGGSVMFGAKVGDRINQDEFSDGEELEEGMDGACDKLYLDGPMIEPGEGSCDEEDFGGQMLEPSILEDLHLPPLTIYTDGSVDVIGQDDSLDVILSDLDAKVCESAVPGAAVIPSDNSPECALPTTDNKPESVSSKESDHVRKTGLVKQGETCGQFKSVKECESMEEPNSPASSQGANNYQETAVKDSCSEFKDSTIGDKSSSTCPPTDDLTQIEFCNCGDNSADAAAIAKENLDDKDANVLSSWTDYDMTQDDDLPRENTAPSKDADLSLVPFIKQSHKGRKKINRHSLDGMRFLLPPEKRRHQPAPVELIPGSDSSENIDWFENPETGKGKKGKTCKRGRNVGASTQPQPKARHSWGGMSVGAALAFISDNTDRFSQIPHGAIVPFESPSTTDSESSPVYRRPRISRWSDNTDTKTEKTVMAARAEFSKLTYMRRFSSASVSFIDTHCHIDFLFKRENYRETYADYRRHKAETFHHTYAGCIAVFCDPRTFSAKGLWRQIIEEPGVFAAIGCHPKSARDFSPQAEGFMSNVMLDHPKVKALGEIGLDYSGNFYQCAEIQKLVFARQVNLALRKDLPIVIHCRDAEQDCIELLKKLVPKNHRIHRHCFTGSWAEAEAWLKEFPASFIGLTPLITYMGGRSEAPREVAKNIPLEKLLLETDAPYFVPRGMPKEEMPFSHPGMAISVAAEVARLKFVDLNTVLKHCLQNTSTMYGVKLQNF